MLRKVPTNRIYTILDRYYGSI